MPQPTSASKSSIWLAATAAFCTYFCMYAFRKPFTAATFELQPVFIVGFRSAIDESVWTLGFKTLLILSQVSGYMLSKFVGIKVVSEMQPNRRAVSIISLIVVAELALVGFAYVPLGLKPLMLLLNGLPLGMIFGLVLAFLEGRKHTEALSAVLCASFIVSSGAVKSIGQWLIQDMGVPEFKMPMVTGLLFFVPLLVSVYFLQRTPAPDAIDRRLRSARTTMNRRERWEFFAAYWPGLCLLVFVYVALTVIRTLRDDFGVEIWRDLGVSEEPSVFARSEFCVAVAVTGLNATVIAITNNLRAIRWTLVAMCLSFTGVALSGWAVSHDILSPFGFMVLCGVGLYIPYVAFHTTVFERLIAASKRPGNLGFLMYVADAMGYLGYTAILVGQTTLQEPASVLPMFQRLLIGLSLASVVAIFVSMLYLQSKLSIEAISVDRDSSSEHSPERGES